MHRVSEPQSTDRVYTPHKEYKILWSNPLLSNFHMQISFSTDCLYVTESIKSTVHLKVVDTHVSSPQLSQVLYTFRPISSAYGSTKRSPTAETVALPSKRAFATYIAISDCTRKCGKRRLILLSTFQSLPTQRSCRFRQSGRACLHGPSQPQSRQDQPQYSGHPLKPGISQGQLPY